MFQGTGCQSALVSVAVQVLQCYGTMYTSESSPCSKASSCEDVEFTTDVDKAELLNKQFFSNFNHLHPSLLCNDPSLTPADPSECPDYLLCTEDQVYNLILSLDVSKATGADNISARMLKGTVSSITPSLTKMFNLSI